MAKGIGGEDLSPLFDFEGLIYDRVETQLNQFIVFMNPDFTTIQCPKCGRTRSFSHDGNYIRDCVDLPLHDTRTVLRINAGRYNCNNPICTQKKFVGQFPDAYGSNDKITHRLKDRIANSDFKKHTFDSVASRYFVDPETVRKAFLEKVARLDRRSDYATVTCLGIDEAHLANEMRGVLVDCSKKDAELVDILPDRRKVTIKAALRRFEHPEKIKYVTMDMSVAYREAVREVLPDAMIVIDRFHVIQSLMDATKKARENACAYIEQEIAKKPPEERTEPELTWSRKRANAYLFLKNLDNLSERQERELASLVNDFEIFGDIVRLRTTFAQIYECKTRADAEDMYESWVRMIPSKDKTDHVLYPFYSTYKTIENWKEWIFNFFAVPEGVNRTNAPVEAFNGVIKRINRDGKGYKYEVLRGKMLFGDKYFDLKPQPYEREDSSTYAQALFKALNKHFDYFDGLNMKRLLQRVQADYPSLYAEHEYLVGVLLGDPDDYYKQEYWVDREPFYTALRDCAEKMDEECDDARFHCVKRAVPVEELSATVDHIIAGIALGYDQEFLEPYKKARQRR